MYKTRKLIEEIERVKSGKLQMMKLSKKKNVGNM